MLQNYLNKSGKLNAIAQSKLNRFNFVNSYCKLSDFYTSRTTHIAGVLTTDLFVISYDKEKIIKMGFNSRVKAIISPNKENKYSVKFFEERLIIEKEKREKKSQLKKEFNDQCDECKKVIESNEKFIEFIQRKRLEGNKDRTIAWKLNSSTRVPNLSKFTISVIYNSICHF